jgi:seryl-tRNA synthetase
MQKLNDPDAPWAIALELDERRRQILTQVETLRAERNAGSKRVGKLFREKKTHREANDAQGAHERHRRRDRGAGRRTARGGPGLPGRHAAHPQPPEPDVPVGKDDSGNVVVKEWGVKPQLDFAPLPHWELGEKLGIIDFERGSSSPAVASTCSRARARACSVR